MRTHVNIFHKDINYSFAVKIRSYWLNYFSIIAFKFHQQFHKLHQWGCFLETVL